MSKSSIYYTSNKLDARIMSICQKQLKKCFTGEIVSISLKPIDFGRNIVFDGEVGVLTMFKQILTALENTKTDFVFHLEHDILYHPTHFEFVPPEKDKFYYNTNVYKMRFEDGHAMRVDDCRQTSGLCACRDLLLEHYRKRVDIVEKDGYSKSMGFEAGTHGREARVDDYKSDTWESEFPNIDIRHNNNLTPSRWEKSEFRNKRYTKGWTETDNVPGWGSLAWFWGRI